MMLHFDFKFPLHYGEFGICTLDGIKYDIKVEGDLGWFYIRCLQNHREFCEMLNKKFPDIFPLEMNDLLRKFKCNCVNAGYFPEFSNLKDLEKFIKFVNNYSEL